MATFHFGFIIRKRREDLGITQEDLADGICSCPTLSRIENGERLPKKAYFDMLVQRLGLSDTILDSCVDEKRLYIHELKYQIRQAVILNKMDEAERLLSEFLQSTGDATQIDKQFSLLYETIIHAAQYDVPQKLERLTQAIRLTCPKYDEKRLPKLLSYEEIIILNNIAVCLFQGGDCDGAISLLYQLKRFYESRVMNPEEMLRTQPMVLYNLSKYLGNAKRYDECIAICNAGIQIARETGRCSMLDRMLYNRAWSYVRRNNAGDLDAARDSAIMAYQKACIMQQSKSKQLYATFIKKYFPDVALLED